MYDARSRDRFRAAITVVTGGATAASLAAAGLVAGMVAQDPSTGQDASAPPSPEPATTAQAGPVVVKWKERPRRTVVRTRTVYRTVAPATNTLGGGSVGTAGSAGGATVSSTGGSWSQSTTSSGVRSTSGSASTGSGSQGSAGGAAAHPAPPPPPPPRPAAPSSGS